MPLKLYTDMYGSLMNTVTEKWIFVKLFVAWSQDPGKDCLSLFPKRHIGKRGREEDDEQGS